MNEIRTQFETHRNTPSIYVACLSAYNNGYLHGSWVDVSEGADHVREQIQSILKNSPVAEECEEWAIHDFENFGNYRVSEWHDLEELCEIAELIKESESLLPDEIVTSLINDYGIEGAREKIQNDYIGEFRSDLYFTYHYIDEIGLFNGASEEVTRYFDYESYSRDIENNAGIVSFDGHYFYNA